MTAIEKRTSVIESEMGSRDGALDLAVARVELRVEALLAEAANASGKTQREIADELGVTEGRVSQVFSGGGAIKVATLARYLHAMGYQLEFAGEPMRQELERIPRPKRIRGESSAGRFVVHARNHQGAGGDSPQVMFALEPADGAEGWEVVGEARGVRGHIARYSNNAASTPASTGFKLGIGGIR